MKGVCGIVGASGSGKTRLCEVLTERLTADGIHVGYLKHCHHALAYEDDHDSGRVRRAGALTVGATDTNTTLVVESTIAPAGLPWAALARLTRADVILVEGWHQAPWPKIVVEREGEPGREAAPPIVGRVGSDEDGLNLAGIDAADRAVREIMRRSHAADRDGVSLVVDGRPVPVQGFAASAIAGMVRGLLDRLEGASSNSAISLTLTPLDRTEPPVP